jgi:hypothetical protein
MGKLRPDNFQSWSDNVTQFPPTITSSKGKSRLDWALNGEAHG